MKLWFAQVVRNRLTEAFGDVILNPFSVIIVYLFVCLFEGWEEGKKAGHKSGWKWLEKRGYEKLQSREINRVYGNIWVKCFYSGGK